MLIVEHRVYGRGKVQKKRFGGFELYVEFEDGISRWVRSDEVIFLSETPTLKKHEPSRPILSEEQFKARQIIEALRLGVVPPEYVESFTFGRGEEIKQIKSWLDNSSKGSLIIVGEYGAGKTHLLEYIYFFALSNNWAVSMVKIDPNEAPFHKPKVVYQKIISSFRFKSRNGNFREFLRSIAFSTKGKRINDYCFHEKFEIKEYREDGCLIYCPLHDTTIREGADLCKGCKYYYLNVQPFHPVYELREHEYLGKVIEKIRNRTDDEHMWEWIEGNSASYYSYPQMYEHSTCANVYCYILSGIGWAAKNILGLNGFLILFDEAESVEPYWHTSYQNSKAWNFLTGIILMTNNDKRLLEDLECIDGIDYRYSWSGYPQGLWGKYTGLQYCGYNRLPFIWKIPCYVKSIFTFTKSEILDKEPLNNLTKLEIEHLDNESLMKISSTIINLYQKAYNFQLKNRDLSIKKLFNLIPKEKHRLFIKGIIESLDLLRFHPDKPIEMLLK